MHGTNDLIIADEVVKIYASYLSNEGFETEKMNRSLYLDMPLTVNKNFDGKDS